MAETLQQRLFAIRLALGGGVRPLPLDQLAERLNAGAGGAAYDAPMLSLMERGKRRVTLEDVAALAALDPKGRGRAWLAWGDAPPPAPARRPSPIDGLPADDGHLVDVTPSHQKKGRRRKS